MQINRFYSLKCGTHYLNFNIGGGKITLHNLPTDAFQCSGYEEARSTLQKIFTNIGDYEFTDPSISLQNVYIVEVTIEEIAIKN